MSATLSLPKIGTDVPSAGGIFAGILAGLDGAEDQVVIIGPERDREASWSAQKKWVSGIKVSGFADFDLGTRREHRLAFINVPHLFEKTWYWTREQHASFSGDAWAQLFSYGDQGYWGKYNELRARAVRRLPISQFLNLIGAMQTPEAM